MPVIQTPSTDYYMDSHGGIFRTVGNTVSVFNLQKGDFVERDMSLLDLDTRARPVEEGEALDAIDRLKAQGAGAPPEP